MEPMLPHRKSLLSNRVIAWSSGNKFSKIHRMWHEELHPQERSVCDATVDVRLLILRAPQLPLLLS